MENKQAICDALLETLKLTRADVTKLTYLTNEYGEFVRVQYGESPLHSKKVDVTADSGISLIRDVMRAIN